MFTLASVCTGGRARFLTCKHRSRAVGRPPLGPRYSTASAACEARPVLNCRSSALSSARNTVDPDQVYQFQMKIYKWTIIESVCRRIEMAVGRSLHVRIVVCACSVVYSAFTDVLRTERDWRVRRMCTNVYLDITTFWLSVDNLIGFPSWYIVYACLASRSHSHYCTSVALHVLFSMLLSIVLF